MAENPHYKELLRRLNEFQVEYLIVGGFAVMKYGEPRYTKDLDIRSVPFVTNGYLDNMGTHVGGSARPFFYIDFF